MSECIDLGLSSDSLTALLHALGFSDKEDSTENPPLTSPKSPVYRDERPKTPFAKLDSNLDEIQNFSRDFLSDFEMCSELEEDSDFETLPSRPESSLESFEVVSLPSELFHDNIPKSAQLYPTCRAQVDFLYIKAALNASIIMLRAPRNITLLELKRRLYDKFVNQENLLLSSSFSIVHALPPKSRSGTYRRRVSFADCTEMRFVDHENDWRRITLTNDGSKITLRIVDTPL